MFPKRCLLVLISLLLVASIVFCALPFVGVFSKIDHGTQALNQLCQTTEMTFYPDKHPETSSVDGYTSHKVVGGDDWNIIRGGGGTYQEDEGNYFFVFRISSDYDEDKWIEISKAIILFDTSALPDDCVITSATLSLYGRHKFDCLGINPHVNIYGSAPASINDIIEGDHDSVGDTDFCDTQISFSNWDTTGYNDFVLNAAGLAAISKTGTTKLGARESYYDADNVEPEWSYFGDSYIDCWSADELEPLERRPRLVITYITEAPTVTTNDATNVTNDSATLNGYLDDDGGVPCACGFLYGETSEYGENVTASGTYTTGQSFSVPISDLETGQEYHFRAWAYNGVTTSYGSDKEFITGIYLSLWYDFNTAIWGTNFPDSSSNSNNATLTFRVAGSDPDVTAVVSDQYPEEETETDEPEDISPSPPSQEPWDIVPEPPEEPEGIFDEGGTDFPGGAELMDIFGEEYELYLFIFVFFIAIVAGLIVFWTTHRSRMGVRGSLLLMAVMIEGVLVYFYIGTHTIPGWSLIPIGLAALVLLIWRNPLSSPLN